jgi:hypothetical protein
MPGEADARPFLEEVFGEIKKQPVRTTLLSDAGRRIAGLYMTIYQLSVPLRAVSSTRASASRSGVWNQMCRRSTVAHTPHHRR